MKIVVAVPCYNEEQSVASVVRDFKSSLPEAQIFVYDNGSSDQTKREALCAGAIVRDEKRRGKGYVARRFFSDVEADIYLLVDGDGTYDASAAPKLVQTLLSEQVDMVVATRENIQENAGRQGHALGNAVFNAMYARLFGRGFTDIFSGYRVFTRRFVKSFPAASSGFELETEICAHASQMEIPMVEVPTTYRLRGANSYSKLRTIPDGLRILRTFVLLTKEMRPAMFFGGLGCCTGLLGTLLSIPIFRTYVETGLVPRFPTFIGITGLAVIATVLCTCGIILDSVSRLRIEQKRLVFLSFSAPSATPDPSTNENLVSSHHPFQAS